MRGSHLLRILLLLLWSFALVTCQADGENTEAETDPNGTGGTAASATGQQQGDTGGTIYEPANGFYVCREVNAVCNVIGCDTGGCSVINNGFDVSTRQGRVVYTARTKNADLSIAGGDSSTAIRCQSACTCQHIFRNVGCTIPKIEELAEGLVDGEGNGLQLTPVSLGVNNQVNVMLQEESKASDTHGSVLLLPTATIIMALLLPYLVQ